MTKEFVAETINISRQAVSKWKTGDSDLSTSNLFVLAKLFGLSVEKLLQEVKFPPGKIEDILQDPGIRRWYNRGQQGNRAAFPKPFP